MPILAESPAAPSSNGPDDEVLFRALVARKNPGKVTLNEKERDALVSHRIREFEDADSGNCQFKENITEMIANWRGVTDQKDFPFENPLARDTEVLTRSGWRLIPEIQIGEEVLTRRDEDGGIEWNPVSDLPRVEATTLIHFKSRSIDMACTLGHGMIVYNQTQVGKTQGKREAGKRSMPRRLSADKVSKTTGLFVPLHGVWTGNGDTMLFGLPARDVAEFVGWYLAEGSHNPTGSFFISQSRKINAGKCLRLEQLFKRLGFTWDYHRSAYTVHARTIPNDLANLLREQGRCHEKYVPPVFMEMSAQIIQALIDGLIGGDGSISHYRGYIRCQYYTTSKRLADELQVLAVLSGVHATIHERDTIGKRSQIRGKPCTTRRIGYVVGICSNAWVKLDRATHHEIEYDDTAYCVTVENHSIYVRRNGVPVWSANCANVRVPFTSVVVEQMQARLLKAIFGGDLWAKLEYVDKQIPGEQLDEANLWWNWELREVVKLKQAVRDIIHDYLVTGISVPIPTYDHETEFLHSFKEWEFDPEQSLSGLLEQGIQEILNEPSAWGADEEHHNEVTKQTKPGEFKLDDDGRIVFSLDIDKMRLRADIWRREVVFDGGRINYLSLEDLVVSNTDRDINKVALFGARLFYSLADYRRGLESGFFIDYGPEENQRLIAGADVKQGQAIGRPISDLQDAEEGTNSTDSTSSHPTHKFLEAYRSEGWWVWDKSGDEYGVDKLLQPATQVVTWIEPKSRTLLKIERLEDLNKDGKRSGIKFGFIEEPGRFFPMGLAEWVRHIQYILDAISNQRLDAGLLFNVPFGFYKPTAGLQGTIRIEPGLFYPSADPSSVNMPRANWSPTFGMQEEMLQRNYGMEQAGLSEAAVGRPTSKRQSATEFMSVAAALDLRTEDILERLLESLKELLTRVLGLYQHHAPRERIFRVGGEGGVQVTKKFEKDRLQGKILLTMCGNLDLINEQVRHQTALDMFSLLMNQILVQSQIVGPDTIYAAIKLIAKLSHYDDVPLHKPRIDPVSDAPEVEEKQMFAGQKPTGPTMGENTGEHMQHHAMTAADSKLMESWSPQARQLLEQHLRDTMQMQQAQEMVAKQRAAMAVQAAMQMEKMGINPGMPGGQQPTTNTGPGTQEEGVQGQGSMNGATAAAPMPGQNG